MDVLLAWLTDPLLGYGVGTGLGAGGAGVKQTSGIPKVSPPPLLEAGNIAGISSYSPNLNVFFQPLL